MPDTGSSRSIFGSNFADKYDLVVDESSSARKNLLYNASDERMAVRGVVDLQAQYKGTMCYIDGLVLRGRLAAPLISWHDLSQLKICNLPVADKCNFCSSSSKSSNNEIIKENQISNAQSVKFDDNCKVDKNKPFVNHIINGLYEQD